MPTCHGPVSILTPTIWCLGRESFVIGESAARVWSGCLGRVWHGRGWAALLGSDTLLSRQCSVLGCLHRYSCNLNPSGSTEMCLWCLCVSSEVLCLSQNRAISSDQVRQLSTLHCSSARISTARLTGCFVLTVASFTGATAICILRHSTATPV